LEGKRHLESRAAWLWSIAATWIARVGISCAAALTTANAALAANPSDPTRTEQWGVQEGDLRTRLVPLADHFTLGQPMRFRLELQNVGKAVAHYDPQQVDIGSLAVRDPQGHAVRYIGGSFQTWGGRRPAITPGNFVVLFDQLDIDSQYLLVKPGKHSVQFRGYAMPPSNTVEIDVRPGTLPPIVRVAARLLDVVPKKWDMTIRRDAGDADRSQPVGWDDPPPGWEPGRGMPSILLDWHRNGELAVGVRAVFWLSHRKLKWTGKVPGPGQTAAAYYGKCREGCLYAELPSRAAAAASQWPTFEKDVSKALQIEDENPVLGAGGVKNDDDLKRLEGLARLDLLHLDGAKITDAGLKHLEGLTRLKSLWLSRTQVTDRGLQSLKKLPQLERLSLNGDNISDVGVENLKALGQLEHLSLNATRITDGGLKRLKELTRLEYLSLNETSITDAGLETVKGFTRLRCLDLDGTRISDAGLQHIKGLTKIERLSLANTRITDAGLDHLKGLIRLEHLDLDETQVTDAGVGRLQHALPRCELFYRSEEDSRKRWEAAEKEARDSERETSAISRVQPSSRPDLEKHYIIQFDKPGLKRQPLLVIVWKGRQRTVTLDRLNTDTPAVAINEHLLTPPRTKKAIYALQPDYSLQQLPLTEEEIQRLFAHIMRSEKRAVSSMEVRILPSDPYWQEKVDPHTRVIDPEGKEKRP
jgi:hypothetical protein